MDNLSYEERLKMLKEWELGPFRKWKLDINRLKEINVQVLKEKKEMHSNRGPYNRKIVGSGKKQRERALEKLKYDIENG